MNATFDSANLDLKKLFDDFGMEPTASGFLSIKLQAGGTLADLQAHLDVEGRDLRNPKLTNLDPATFRLSADAAGKKINVTGELKQSEDSARQYCRDDAIRCRKNPEHAFV